MSEEIEVKKATKKVSKKADAPAKVKEPKVKAPKAAKEKKEATLSPRAIPEGYIGLQALAAEFEMDPAALRRKLRSTEGIEKPEGSFGWRWKEGSRELNNLRKLLTKG
jgi:hypothetical protein